MGSYVKVAKTDEIAIGCSKGVDAEGKKIALFNLEGQFFALENDCNHKGGPLCDGPIEDDKVTCPWHGAKFDIKTGLNLNPPAMTPANKFNVRVVGDDVEVEI